MDEKLTKFLNITSIPAIFVVFYLELKTIDEHINQIEHLKNSIIELKETLEICHGHTLGHIHDKH